MIRSWIGSELFDLHEFEPIKWVYLLPTDGSAVLGIVSNLSDEEIKDHLKKSDMMIVN